MVELERSRVQELKSTDTPLLGTAMSETVSFPVKKGEILLSSRLVLNHSGPRNENSVVIYLVRWARAEASNVAGHFVLHGSEASFFSVWVQQSE